MSITAHAKVKLESVHRARCEVNLQGIERFMRISSSGSLTRSSSRYSFSGRHIPLRWPSRSPGDVSVPSQSQNEAQDKCQ